MSRLLTRNWSRRNSGLIVSTGFSDEPNFADGTFTVVDSDDMQAYTDAAYMGEQARFYEPGQTFLPWPSPAVTGGAVDPNQHSVITVNGRQVLRLRYPEAGAGGAWVRKHDVTIPMADESYVQFHARMSSEGTVPVPYNFAIKWIEWMQNINGINVGRRQCSLHNMIPFHLDKAEPGAIDRGTYWQTLPNGGYSDEYGVYPFSYDQGTQPLGPYFLDLVNDGNTHRFTHGFKDMTPADGTVTVVGNVATFSVSQAGKVHNNDRIRMGPRGSLAESQPGHARVVSGFDGAYTCTLTGTTDNSDVGPTQFAINGGGAFSRLWIDGIKVIDTCQAQVGQIPIGGDKQWTGQANVDAFLVGGTNRSAGQLMVGSSQSAGMGFGVAMRIDYYDWLVTTRAAA